MFAGLMSRWRDTGRMGRVERIADVDCNPQDFATLERPARNPLLRFSPSRNSIAMKGRCSDWVDFVDGADVRMIER
jgi:hypothetical protein